LYAPTGRRIEDGDLTAAGSVPASSIGAFADLFARLEPTRREERGSSPAVVAKSVPPRIVLSSPLTQTET
jgi:hypothetical protein